MTHLSEHVERLLEYLMVAKKKVRIRCITMTNQGKTVGKFAFMKFFNVDWSLGGKIVQHGVQCSLQVSVLVLLNPIINFMPSQQIN